MVSTHMTTVGIAILRTLMSSPARWAVVKMGAVIFFRWVRTLEERHCIRSVPPGKALLLLRTKTRRPCAWRRCWCSRALLMR
ncbi:MAG: hypothetical protein ACK55Z_08335, partial [bacterium]